MMNINMVVVIVAAAVAGVGVGCLLLDETPGSQLSRQTKGVFAITDGVSTSVFSFGSNSAGGNHQWVEQP